MTTSPTTSVKEENSFYNARTLLSKSEQVLRKTNFESSFLSHVINRVKVTLD